VPDVAIVGGGIIGAACAHELTGAGATVTLIERDGLAAGASGRNAGWLVTPHDPTTLAMGRISIETYLELAERAPLPVFIDREPIGHLVVVRTERELAAGRAALDTAAATSGITVEPLDGAALRSVEPAMTAAVAGAWLAQDGRRVDPASLTVGLALLAREAGADVRHHVAVRAIATHGERVIGVVTDDGRIDADHVIVAAGPWSGTLLEPIGVSLPLVGARGWLVRVDGAPDAIHHLVQEVDLYGDRRNEPGTSPPTVHEALDRGLPPGTSGVGLHPHPDGSVRLGSSRQPWLTPEPEDAAMVRQILRNAMDLYPTLADATVSSSWWGLRPMTPDERPTIGMVNDGLIVATGHGSEGVILGAGTARLVAAMVAGAEPPFDPGPFDPFRFG
jgi:glycine/D-amino acid oxidase-like deaminating enzyme